MAQLQHKPSILSHTTFLLDSNSVGLFAVDKITYFNHAVQKIIMNSCQQAIGRYLCGV
jgi:hypothetical protein